MNKYVHTIVRTNSQYLTHSVKQTQTKKMNQPSHFLTTLSSLTVYPTEGDSTKSFFISMRNQNKIISKILVASFISFHPFLASSFQHHRISYARLSTHLYFSSSSTSYLSMPRGVKKENLPQKICVTCNRPFTW